MFSLTSFFFTSEVGIYSHKCCKYVNENLKALWTQTKSCRKVRPTLTSSCFYFPSFQQAVNTHCQLKFAILLKKLPSLPRYPQSMPMNWQQWMNLLENPLAWRTDERSSALAFAKERSVIMIWAHARNQWYTNIISYLQFILSPHLKKQRSWRKRGGGGKENNLISGHSFFFRWQVLVDSLCRFSQKVPD